MELAASQDCVLAWLEAYGGGSPGCKSLGADGNVVGSRIDPIEFKESVVVRHDGAGIFGDRALKSDCSARNGVVVHIGYSADNNSGLGLGRVRQRSRLLLSLGRPWSAKADHQYKDTPLHRTSPGE